MKSRKNPLFFVALVLIVLSCDSSDPDPSINNLSEFAQKFMSMRLGSPKAMNRNSNAAINQSFQSMMSSHGFSGGRIKSDSTGSSEPGKDSTVFQDPWVSCAVVSTIENSDGSTTTIYDYGDGCEEGWGDYKYFMHGKTIQTYKYNSQHTGGVIHDTYLFKMLYDNYGGHYNVDSSDWSTDGNSFYEGYSSYDTSWNKFSGAYSYNDTSLYTYGGKAYDYKSKGSTHYDETGWVVEESDYEYGDGTDYYRSTVIEPLVSKTLCNSFEGGMVADSPYVWVAVTGREVIHYKQGDKEGSFEIDYGNGECDNIIYITENGIRVTVDLGAGWMLYAKEG
ncbi:MAG: hypothetical protein ABI663_24200 [Chryseolinea sp.]